VETYRIKKGNVWNRLGTLFSNQIHASTNFPLASPVIMQDFYMDDLLTGAKTVEEPLELKSLLSGIDLVTSLLQIKFSEGPTADEYRWGGEE
jgi:hypothetical protein